MANSMDFSLVLRAKTEQFKQEMAQARIQLKQLVQALEELNRAGRNAFGGVQKYQGFSGYTTYSTAQSF